MTPIEQLLAEVEWRAGEKPDTVEPGRLYATHEGALELFGKRLRCYRLNNGQAVIHGDDMQALFAEVAP